MSTSYPKNTLEQAHTILRVWRETKPEMLIGEMTLKQLEDVVDDAEKDRDAIETTEAQLDKQRDKRDESYEEAWDHVKRSRAGFKGAFGDDSTEYERVGGKRRSDRKKPTRAPKTTTVA